MPCLGDRFAGIAVSLETKEKPAHRRMENRSRALDLILSSNYDSCNAFTQT